LTSNTSAPEGDAAVPELRDFHVQVDEQRAQQAAQRAYTGWEERRAIFNSGGVFEMGGERPAGRPARL